MKCRDQVFDIKYLIFRFIKMNKFTKCCQRINQYQSRMKRLIYLKWKSGIFCYKNKSTKFYYKMTYRWKLRVLVTNTNQPNITTKCCTHKNQVFVQIFRYESLGSQDCCSYHVDHHWPLLPDKDLGPGQKPASRRFQLPAN